jgi:hypothetical protein
MRHYLTIVLLVIGVAGDSAGVSAQAWGRTGSLNIGACFYEHIEFGGRFFCLPMGAEVTRLSSDTNDEISSIRLFGNAEVVVYRDGNFTGRSVRFTESANDLRPGDWSDRITSFRIEMRPGRGGVSRGNRGGGVGSFGTGLEAFADINFKGRSATYSANTPDVAATGMGAMISSLRVPIGETWQVCTEANYQGRCRLLTENQSDLRRGEWNDVIGSLRRVR